MNKNRLEAFSDGVLAIIITIMVLELKVPHDATIHALIEMTPLLLSYVLSFLYVAIYWNNHHHLLHTIEKTNGRILWANNYLLFWLSLIPFVTAWSGENHFKSLPVASYGVVLFMAAVAYFVLSLSIISVHGRNSILSKAIGRDMKGKASILLYAIAVPIAFLNSYIALSIYFIVAIIWLIPDSRIERAMSDHTKRTNILNSNLGQHQ